MNWAGCKTDNSVITMRNDTCHVTTVLGRQEGVVGSVENLRTHALLKGAAVTQPQGNCCPVKWPESRFRTTRLIFFEVSEKE